MALYYNKSESEEFAKLGINANGNAIIYFSEATIIENDDYVELYAYVDKADEVIKSIKGGDGKFARDEFFIFEPQVCRFTLTKKEHEREYNGKKTKKIPTEKELLIIELLQKLNSKYFKGKIDFNCPDSIIANYYNKIDSEPTKAALWIEALIEAEAIEESAVQHLNKISLESTKKQSGYGSKSQRELDKLKDRLTFIKHYMMGAEGDIALAEPISIDDSLQIYRGMLAQDSDQGILRHKILELLLRN